MGRYYYNQQGEEGKFWVGVQPSDDPRTVYGMDEIEPDEPDESWGEAYMDYWADDSEFIKLKLDMQFVRLGVPVGERKYEFRDATDIGNYVWDELIKYYMTEEKPKDSRIIGYYMGKDEPTLYPIDKDKELAASRIQLGLFILNTIRKYGECSLNAEL